VTAGNRKRNCSPEQAARIAEMIAMADRAFTQPATVAPKRAASLDRALRNLAEVDRMVRERPHPAAHTARKWNWGSGRVTGFTVAEGALLTSEVGPSDVRRDIIRW
jgi:hypothetical protein